MPHGDRLSLLVLNPLERGAWGGVETWLFDLALGLRDRGHRVVVAGCPESTWTRRTEAAGFPVLRVPLRADFDFGQARAVARFMREHEVDVVATKLHRGIRVSGFAARIAGRTARRTAGGPTARPPVVAFMGLVETRRGWRYRWTYRLFLDRVVTLSDAMRDEIAAEGRLDPSAVVTIPYGIRPGEYDVPASARDEVRAELGLDAAAPTALALGRMHAQKRFDLLLEAFRRVHERLPAARLVIAGEGRLLPEIDAHRRRLGLVGTVTLLGFRRDVARLLAAADCLVLSSDFEGLPMVVLEAMAAGRPVVATDVGSLPEMVEHGRTGLVVPKGDAAALADALVAVLGAPDRGRSLGDAGRARVLERYPLERCIVETERFLRSARR